MKSFKDIYKFPLIPLPESSWVYDSADNFVFQFEHGYFGERSQTMFETMVLDCINHDAVITGKTFFDGGNGTIECETVCGKRFPVITIRGWGGLTGANGHRLSDEVAANIQDTFQAYLLEKLNSK